MFTQPRDTNNKNKPAYKKYCSYCNRTNRSIEARFKKHRADEDKRKACARSKSPQKSFVQYFRSPSNDRTKRYDTRYRSRSNSRNKHYNKNTNSQNRYRSASRDRFSYDKNTTPPQYTQSRYDNYKRDSRSYRSPYRSSSRSPYRHGSRHRYRSRSFSRDINNFTKYTSSYRPPSRPSDSRYSRSRSHSNTRNKNNTIQPQHQNDPINLKYTCIIQLKWQTR